MLDTDFVSGVSISNGVAELGSNIELSISAGSVNANSAATLQSRWGTAVSAFAPGNTTGVVQVFSGGSIAGASQSNLAINGQPNLAGGSFASFPACVRRPRQYNAAIECDNAGPAQHGRAERRPDDFSATGTLPIGKYNLVGYVCRFRQHERRGNNWDRRQLARTGRSSTATTRSICSSAAQPLRRRQRLGAQPIQPSSALQRGTSWPAAAATPICNPAATGVDGTSPRHRRHALDRPRRRHRLPRRSLPGANSGNFTGGTAELWRSADAARAISLEQRRADHRHE